MNKYFMDVPVKNIQSEIARLLEHFEMSHSDICSKIDSTGLISDDDRAAIMKYALEFKGRN